MVNIDKLYANQLVDDSQLSTVKSNLKSIAKYSPALMLAAAVPAEGQIECTTVPLVTSGSFYNVGTNYIDIDGDGTDDFFFLAATTFFYGPGAFFAPLSSNSFVRDNSELTPANLPAGFPIASTLPGSLSWNNYYINLYGYGYGHFNSGDPAGYLGVRFDISGSTHYGWIEVDVDFVPGATTITAHNWGYHTIANNEITSGSCEDSVEIVPTMQEWGIIILNLFLLIFGVVAFKEQGQLKLKRKEA